MKYLKNRNKFQFSFKSVSLLFAQFRVPTFTIWLKQQQFALIVIILDLYSRDLQITIIPFKCNVSSHKFDRIFSELPSPALSCLLYSRVSNLMNALQGECLCFRKIFINVSKLLFIYLVEVCPCRIVVARLLVYPLFLY